MGSFFVGCSACSVMLILSDADGPGRARRAGWSLTEWGWRCPKHIELPAGDPVAEPFPLAATPEAAPAAVTG